MTFIKEFKCRDTGNRQELGHHSVKDSQPDKTLSEEIRKVWQMTWNLWEILRVNGKRNYVGTRNMKHFYSHGVKFCCLAKVAGIQQRYTEGVLWCNDLLLCLYVAERLGLQGNYKTIGSTIRQNFCIPN